MLRALEMNRERPRAESSCKMRMEFRWERTKSAERGEDKKNLAPSLLLVFAFPFAPLPFLLLLALRFLPAAAGT